MVGIGPPMRGQTREGGSMSEGEGEKKGGSMMKLIIMAVVALLVLGGGGYGVMMFLGKKKAAAAAEAEKAKGKEGAKAEGEGGEHGEAKEGEGKEAHGAKADEEDEDDAHAEGGGHGEGGGAMPVLVHRQIVNLEGPRRNAFLKVEIHILFRDPDVGKNVASDKPTTENSQTKAILLELLSGRTLEEARDLEFRESLRAEIKDRLNKKFAPKPPKPGEKEDPKKKKPKKPIKDVLVVDWAIQE